MPILLSPERAGDSPLLLASGSASALNALVLHDSLVVLHVSVTSLVPAGVPRGTRGKHSFPIGRIIPTVTKSEWSFSQDGTQSGCPTFLQTSRLLVRGSMRVVGLRLVEVRTQHGLD